MYFAPENAHVPLQAPQYYIDTYCSHIPDHWRAIHCAQVVFLDEMVKNFTEALKAKGMWNDTVLIFTTDNGGEIYDPIYFNPVPDPNRGSAASNWPLRGSKFTYWEGGIRAVAFIHQRPSCIADQTSTGFDYNGLVHISDLYPTIIEGIAHINLGPYRKRLDGINMWQYLIGNLPSPRTEMLINFDPMDADLSLATIPFRLTGALRVGDLKLIVGAWNSSYQYGPNYSPPSNLPPDSTPCQDFVFDKTKVVHVYNITADPYECIDIAYENENQQLTFNLLRRFWEIGAQTVLPQDPYDIVCSPRNTGGIITPCAPPSL